jgi:Flp pilus assembly protein TadD
MLRLWKSSASALLCVSALVCTSAAAQNVLLDVVQTVAAPSSAAPVEHTLEISNAGNYQITLTDLGAQLTPSAPLASVALAVTSSNAIVGTPLMAAGTTTLAAATGTYQIHVVGTPGSTPGSGPIGITVTQGATLIASFSDTLAPPASSIPNNEGVLNSSFTVPNSGNYQVTLTDLQFPQSLTALTLVIVPQGQNPVFTLPGSTNPVTLQAGVTYDIFAVGQASGSPGAGMYAVTVAPSGGGTAVFSAAIPVGAVAQVGSPALPAQSITLTLADLALPSALAQLGAVVVLNGQVVAQLAAAGSQAFTATAGNYQVYALAEPGASGQGAYSLILQPASGAAALSIARAVSLPGSTYSAYSFDANIPNAGTYALDLADFAYPNSFGSLSVQAVQGGMPVGAALTAPGTVNITPAAGPLSLLAFAQPGSAGGLFGVDLVPSNGNNAIFAATQGVGQLFAAQQLTIVNAGTYQVAVTDLAFPAAFANLAVIVTRGSSRIGSIFGGGTFPFTATSGTYNINFVAQPAQTSPDGAGTYAMVVSTAPPAPTVNLSSTASSVSSGGTVDLVWSTQNATSCTASGGWSGSEPLSGQVTTAALTATTTFTLTCSGSGGTGAQSVKVTVSASSGGGGGGELDYVLLGVLVAVVIMRVRSAAWRAAARSMRPPSCGDGLGLGMLALVAAGLVSGCGGAQSRFAAHLDRGEQYFAHGDYTKASVEFRNALQIRPEDPHARLLAGQAAERLGRLPDAAALYQSVVDAAPENLEARADLGHLLVSVRSSDAALKVIEPGLKKHPDDPRLLTLRAVARSQLKDIPGALADVTRALQLAPNNEEAIEVRAGLYKQAGDLPGAVALVSGAVANLPKSQPLRQALVELYSDAGEPAKAEQQLHALIELAPGEARYRYQLAMFYARANRLDEAQRELEGVVKSFPASVDAKLTLVDFLNSRRTPAQAEQVLRGFIAQDADSYRLRLALGALLRGAGRLKEASVVYNEVIQRDGVGPQGLTARDQLAGMQLDSGQSEEARKLVEQVLQHNPRDNEALTLRARIALAQHDPALAITDLRAVLRDQPQSVEVRKLLAAAYLMSNQTALAEEALRAAVQLAPNDTGLAVELGRLLIELRQPDQAIAALEHAVALAPSDEKLRTELTQAYLDKRDFVNALSSARELQTLHPDSAAGFYLAGLAAVGERQLDEAQQSLQQAHAMQPGAYDTLSALARLEVARGHLGDAIELVQSACQRNAADARALNLLGELYLAQRNPQLASDTFIHAIKVLPAWWVPYRNLALARNAANDPTGAMAAYEAALKIAPEEGQLASELAVLYETHGKASDAIALYENLHRQRPQSAAIAEGLAMLLVTYRSDRPSLDEAGALTAGFASSTDGRLLDANGWVHFKRGEYAQALPSLERASERAPDLNEIRYHLGMTELSLGHTARARADLESALAGSGSFVGSDQARTTLAALKSNGAG